AYVKDRYDQYILEDIPEEVTRSVFFTRRNKFNSYSKRRPQYAYARIWHLRLGHPGPETLKHLVNASQGVRIRGLKTVEYDHCGTAKIRRQTRRTPRFENKPPLKRGERFAIDFHNWEEDDEGYSSLMLVTDRYSGWSWDLYLKDRTAKTIIANLKYLFDYIEHHHNFKPKVVEADNKIYKVKPAVKTWLKVEKLIRVKPSASYTYDQNGGAERSGGIIKEKCKAMGGKLPNMLWREIAKSAVYHQNRTPKASKGWKTPYELLFERKPGQEHLRAYGCKAFAITTDCKRKKNRKKRLDPKAWIGYLVGYMSSNIYCIWVPLRNEVISTRDVIFNEEEDFDSYIESVEDSARHVDLQELAEHLQRITVPEDERPPQSDSESLAPTDQEDPSVVELES